MFEVLGEEYFRFLKGVDEAKNLIAYYVKVSGSTEAKTT